MSVELEGRCLINTQQMEVAVNGPDGATHLILCTGVADLGSGSHETYTFLVGPQLSRRQFVGAIASGALSTVQVYDRSPNAADGDIGLGAKVISIEANYDDNHGYVKVSVEVSSTITMKKIAISYNLSILAELPMF
jgi:hypothetical protein